MTLPLRITALCACVLVACGTTSEQPTATPDEGDGIKIGGHTRPNVAVDAEVGALNEAAVTSAFQSASNGMLNCLKKASSRLPYISGVAGVYVRVDSSGKVKYTFMKRSTLGDHATEQCMLDVIRKQSWPAPVGGKEGFAENELTFDPPDRVRMPVSWSEGDAGKGVDDAKKVLSSCKVKTSSGKLTATLYVETDGSVLAAGVSGEQEGAAEAGDCVADGLKSVKLGSPGSFAAKLTLTSD
jgi:hypothetical protein